MELSLNHLFRRARYILWAGFAVAVSMHLCLTQLSGLREEKKAAKPLTTRFVKRQPRLTKPLEMKKRPRPKRRAIQREMVSVKAKVERQQISSGLQPGQVVQSLARPRAVVNRFASFEQVALEPVFAQSITSAKESKAVVNMSLEMMDVEALDTGKHHAMVVQDPTDKQNIRGFFHLALAYPLSMRFRNAYNWEDRTNYGIIRLARRMNEWTPIRTDVTHRLSFDSREFFKTPWVYLMVIMNIEPTESEVQNLGKYLLGGGFFMAEGDASENKASSRMGYKYLMRFIRDALASQGWVQDRDWSHDVLPNNHPIFHTYYDFDGPPAGAGLYGTLRMGNTEMHPDGNDPTVRGIVIDGRLVVITTNQKYGLAWGSYGPDGHPASLSAYGHLDPRHVFEFGINIIVFALTQEGSITNRVMDTVGY